MLNFVFLKQGTRAAESAGPSVSGQRSVSQESAFSQNYRLKIILLL